MATKKRAAAGAGPIFPHKRKNTETDQIEQVGWCAMLDLGIVDGKRRRRAFYGRTQRERERLNDALRDYQRGVLPKAGKTTVEQWLQTCCAASSPASGPGPGNTTSGSSAATDRRSSARRS